MTTTEVPLGIDEAKPSSRVLRPPGGGSSFSLGHSTTPPQQPRQSSSEASPAVAATKIAEPAVTRDNPQAEGRPSGYKPNPNSHSRIFGDPDPASPSPGRDLAKGASAFNPITGEVYPGLEHALPELDGLRFNGRSPSRAGTPTPGEQKQNTPPQPQQQSRVRQPPGGFSQGIF